MVLCLTVNFLWMGNTLPAQTLMVICSSLDLGGVSLMKRYVCVQDMWYYELFVQLIETTRNATLHSAFRFQTKCSSIRISGHLSGTPITLF